MTTYTGTASAPVTYMIPPNYTLPAQIGTFTVTWSANTPNDIRAATTIAQVLALSPRHHVVINAKAGVIINGTIAAGSTATISLRNSVSDPTNLASQTIPIPAGTTYTVPTTNPLGTVNATPGAFLFSSTGITLTSLTNAQVFLDISVTVTHISHTMWIWIGLGIFIFIIIMIIIIWAVSSSNRRRRVVMAPPPPVVAHV